MKDIGLTLLGLLIVLALLMMIPLGIYATFVADCDSWLVKFQPAAEVPARCLIPN